MNDSRYPIGPFEAPDSDDPEVRRAAMQAIETLPRELKSAVGGLTEGQLDRAYRDGGWTVRQIVHHLADSHINGYVRFKLALTEEQPTLKTYDQESWGENLEALTAPIESSLALLAGLHVRWTALLKAMNANHWERSIVHPEIGVLNLGFLASLYGWHGRHHTAQIAALREREGW